jgi:hypothetical protein
MYAYTQTSPEIRTVNRPTSFAHIHVNKCTCMLTHKHHLRFRQLLILLPSTANSYTPITQMHTYAYTQTSHTTDPDSDGDGIPDRVECECSKRMYAYKQTSLQIQTVNHPTSFAHIHVNKCTHTLTHKHHTLQIPTVMVTAFQTA